MFSVPSPSRLSKCYIYYKLVPVDAKKHLKKPFNLYVIIEIVIAKPIS